MRSTWMLLIIAIVLCSSFANANETYSTGCTLSLQQVLENQANCVRQICGDKIYLKTESIYISEKGTYLLLNELGDRAFIPVLCTDATGCFINAGLASESDLRTGDWANNYKKTCPECGRQYLTACQNKDCSRYGR